MEPTIIDWAVFFAIFGLFIPIYFLIKYYQKTRILDYLLFAGFFFFFINFIVNFQLFLLGITSPIFDLHYALSEQLTNFFLLLHCLRLKWEKNPWYINIVILLDFCLVLVIGFGVLHPDLSMKSFLFQLGHYNMLFVMAVFIYIYSTITPLIMDQRIVLTKRLWIVVGCMWIINPIIIIGAGFSLWPNLLRQFSGIFRLKLFVNLILMVLITVRYPEAVLISHAQLSRALDVYSSIISLKTEEEVHDFGMSSLVAYINQIPVGLLDKSGDS